MFYHKSDPVDSILIILHGRLRVFQEKEEGEIEIACEFGRGDGIGELRVSSKYILSNLCHRKRNIN